MYCANCHAHIDAKTTGFVVCPHCNHVNIASATPMLERYIAHLALPPETKVVRQHVTPHTRAVLRKRARRASIQLVVSLVVSVVSFTLAQNVVANYRIAHAINLNAAGQYADASSILSDVPSLLVLPSIHHSGQTETANTKRWLTYLGYQNSAQELINTKHYSDALAMLQKIPKDYPTYQMVASTIQFTNSALAGAKVLQPAPTAPVQPPAATTTPAAPKKKTSPPAAVYTPPNPIITNSLCKVDVTIAPDLQSVAQNAADVCKKEFPHIEAYLSASIYPAPHPIAFTNETWYAGLTIGSGVQLSAPYLRTEPGDMGAVVHELTHVVQAYPSGPSWITEGIADYVRYELGYTEPWSGYWCGSNARYTDGYGCAATMLRFARNHYDGNIIKEIHTAMRTGTYTDNLFVSKTGKTPDQIWAACLLSDCAGGKP